MLSHILSFIVITVTRKLSAKVVLYLSMSKVKGPGTWLQQLVRIVYHIIIVFVVGGEDVCVHTQVVCVAELMNSQARGRCQVSIYLRLFREHLLPNLALLSFA